MCVPFCPVIVCVYVCVCMCRYATVYTMAPVFSLVLDEDVSADVALTYPELYSDLMKVKIMITNDFLCTIGKSTLTQDFFYVGINQCISRYISRTYYISFSSIIVGGVIMLLGFWLFQSQLIHVVAITFTALVLTELLMVALTIRTWHLIMIASEIVTIAIYIASLVLLQDYFGKP